MELEKNSNPVSETQTLHSLFLQVHPLGALFGLPCGSLGRRRRSLKRCLQELGAVKVSDKKQREKKPGEFKQDWGWGDGRDGHGGRVS